MMTLCSLNSSSVTRGGVAAVLLTVALAAVAGAGPAETPADTRQNLHALLEEPFPADREVLVLPLSRTEEVSLQLVRVRSEVKPHYHQRHAETVVILTGRGVMRIDGRPRAAEPGDVFVLSPGTVHALTVTGTEPVAAVTTFSPGFDGEDRVLIPEESGVD